ncbi:MAG: N-acetyltransferase [Gemmatimonadetes bacterium]|nr:N-acetyltransferase [Gemmatimonadota bacterium]
MSGVSIRSVEGRRDLEAFVRLPWSIYKGRYAHWVPPLLSEERKRLDRRRNPFFEHGAAAYFLALREGRAVGRIAAIENRAHNEFHGDRLGFFGFFESIDDLAVARSLVEAAAEWCRARGLTVLRGPANFSSNEMWGLLVAGFDDPPAVLMPYNPRYYAPLLESLRFTKAKDLLAYRVTRETFPLDRLKAVLDRVLSRVGERLRVRTVNMRRFEEEVRLIRDIYNAAWERNWGFVPMTEAEIRHMARELKPVVDPDLVFIGYVDGEPAGFALALPDVNQAIRHARGRLWPLGLVKILWHMRRIDRIRILTLGVKPEHRRTGLDGLFYRQIFANGAAKGYTTAESSWILEDNLAMRQALEKIGSELHKTYRLYDLPIA